MEPNRRNICIAISALTFFIAFLMLFGVIVDKENMETALGVGFLGLFFLAIGLL